MHAITETWTKTGPKKTWTYSPQRALLRKDGKAFAIVTPDGHNALPPEKAKELLDVLNGPQMYSLKLSWSKPAVKVKKARRH